jgi:hypothetical protein
VRGETLTSGPGRQQLGAGRGADKWGRQHSVPHSIFKPNQTETILFETDSNLPQTLSDPKVSFPFLKNWK